MHPGRRPPRIRVAVTAAAVALLAGNAGAAAAPATTGGLRAEAAHLAAEIQAQGLRLGQLSERFDAAVIHEHGVDTALTADRHRFAVTERRVRALHRALVRLAVASYVDGTTPVPAPPRLGKAGSDPALTTSYAAVVSGEEQHTITTFAALQRTLSGDAHRLTAARRAAVTAVAELRDAAGRARAAQSTEEALLASVKGRLGVLVAADQAAAQRAEAARIATLAARAKAEAPATVRTPRTVASSTTTPPTTAAGPVVTTVPGPPTATPTSVPLSPPPTPAPTTAPTTAATTAPTTAPATASPSTAPTTAPTTGASGAPPAQAPGAAAAIAYARAQLGKPYQWGGAGPASFDCSGLVMMAWSQAGIQFPHLAQDQYDLTAREPLADLLPGDLVFFGTPGNVYHVGLYIGGGDMIDAPETGQDVSISSIYWPNLLGAGRVTSSS